MSDSFDLMPAGPALPPGKTMSFEIKLLRKTLIKVLNQNEKMGPVSVDGIGQIVPAAIGASPGVLDLSRRSWNFGGKITVKNQCDWVLAVEC